MKRAPMSRMTRSCVEYIERMCDDAPWRRDVEGKGDGLVPASCTEGGVERVNADKGVPPGVSTLGVSRKDILDLEAQGQSRNSKVVVDRSAADCHFVCHELQRARSRTARRIKVSRQDF